MSADPGFRADGMEALGWTEALAAAFAPHAKAGLRPARVCSEHKAGYMAWLDGRERAARLAGKFRHATRDPSEWPAVGDWVAVAAGGPDDPAYIHALLPRRTVLARQSAGERASERQILAANVDTLFVMASLAEELNARRLERYLSLAWDGGVEPVLLLSKSDLCHDPEAAVSAAASIAGRAAVHAVSNLTRRGLPAIWPYLKPGRTVALLGPSGVGKSSLVNALLGDEMMATEEVRESDQKGRHTTTARHLIVLPRGGMLIDTPGLREIQLWDAEDGVEEAYADIDALAAGCRFNDCRHESEPGCAVRAAVEAGTLDSGRLHGFHKLRRSQPRHEARNRADERVRWKAATKHLRSADKPKR